jgi:oligoendopeptidase F
VVWEDREIPVPQLLPHLESQDRQTRERAWRTYFSPYISKRDELADIFDELVRLRGSVALNAGFENYRDYAHREKNRFDYTPADCVRWQDSVEQVVVPAVVELRARRRSAMGLESLRPWDLDNDPYGHTPLRPFEDIAGLTGGVARIFSELEPSLAAEFQIMIDEGLLDLGSRKGKAPGGYCNSYPASRRPIIFMNAAGVHGDVKTLLHEAGHAFHCFEWFNIQPSFQRHPGSEMCEVASMTMELLAGPYLARDRGGFYTEEEAGRARADHLEEVLTILTHIAAVDGIQQWIYTNPAGADRDAREAEWIRLRERFDQGVDWSGLRPQRVARWYSQPHFFINPFYYIEYGLAQLAAVQIWRKSLEDPAGTLAGYRRALALGATKSLPELYAAAGAKLVFDPDEMGALVEFVQEQIAAAG